MKKNIFFIFVCFCLFFGFSNVRAFDLESLPELSSLSGFTPYYAILYNETYDRYHLVFFNYNVGHYGINEYGENDTVVSLRSNVNFDGHSDSYKRYSAYYILFSGYDSWTLQYQNDYIISSNTSFADPVYGRLGNGFSYLVYTSVPLYGAYSRDVDTLYYDADYTLFMPKPRISSVLLDDGALVRQVIIDFSDFNENSNNYLFQYRVSDSQGNFDNWVTYYDSSYLNEFANVLSSNMSLTFTQFSNCNIEARVILRSDYSLGVVNIIGLTDNYSITDISQLSGYVRYYIPVDYNMAIISGVPDNSLIYVQDTNIYNFGLYHYSTKDNDITEYPLSFDYMGTIRVYNSGNLSEQVSITTPENIIILCLKRNDTIDDLYFYLPSGAHVSYVKEDYISDSITKYGYSYLDYNGNLIDVESVTHFYLTSISNDLTSRVYTGIKYLDDAINDSISLFLDKMPALTQIKGLVDLYSWNYNNDSPPEFRVNLDLRNIGVPLYVDEKVIDFTFYVQYRDYIFAFCKVIVSIITFTKIANYLHNDKAMNNF